MRTLKNDSSVVKNDLRIIDVDGVLGRIKQHEGFKFDSEIARLFEVANRAVSQWKSRGNIPNEYFLNYAKEREISLNWLVWGEGPKKVGALFAQEEKGRYDITVKPEALYSAAERLYAACDRLEFHPNPAGFKLMLRSVASAYLAGVSMSDEELDQLIGDLARSTNN